MMTRTTPPELLPVVLQTTFYAGLRSRRIQLIDNTRYASLLRRSIDILGMAGYSFVAHDEVVLLCANRFWGPMVT